MGNALAAVFNPLAGGPSKAEIRGFSPATTYAFIQSGAYTSAYSNEILESLRNRNDAALRARIETIQPAWALVGDIIRLENDYNARGYGVITVDKKIEAEGDSIPAYLEFINDPMTKLQNKGMTLLTDYWYVVAGAGILTILVLRRK